MFIELSYVAPLLFLVFFASSVAADKKWRIGKNYISDLGVSKSPLSRFLFNGGCVICAALFIAAITELIFEHDLSMVEFAVMALAIFTGVLFALVGIVNEDIRPHHRRIALSFFGAGFILCVALIIMALFDARYILVTLSVSGIILTIISTKKLNWKTTEVVGSVVLLAIISAHFFTIV